MATATSSNDFLALVRKSGLVEEAKLLDLFSTEADIPDDAQKCATALVRAGLLTVFQSRQLLAGKFRGFQLGVYRILQPIGKGGMGTVFLAEHMSLKRKVALKVLPAAKAVNKLSLERFNREARAAAALDHPNIVRLHDISQGNGLHFLVMEFVDGVDLQSLMAKTGPLHYVQAAEYVAQAAAGLQHAHSKGFVHRDIKPGNLMLTKEGVIKILDMGLARSFTDEDDKLTEQLGEATEVAGTADYISPEQALNQTVNERSDIYSLGATLFSLMTGHPPFRGTTAQKLMQHQIADPPSLTKLRAVVPPPLGAVVARMMVKKPSERYATMGDVLDALAPWLPAPTTGNIAHDPMSTQEIRAAAARSSGGLPIIEAAPPSRTPPPVAPPEPRKPERRSPALLLGGIAAAVVVLGGVAGVAAALGGLFDGPQDTAPNASLTNHNSNVTPNTEPTKTTPKTTSGTTTTTPVTPTPTPTPPTIVAGELLYRSDFRDRKPFEVSTQSGKLVGDKPDLPLGWGYHVFKPESQGRFRLLVEAGTPSLGAWHLGGEVAASQITFDPSKIADLKFDTSRTYDVTLEYKLDEGQIGNAAIQAVPPTALPGAVYSQLANAPLKPTGTWQRATMKFRPTVDQRYQILLKPNLVDANRGVFVRSIEFTTAESATPLLANAETVEKLLYRLDFSKLLAYSFEYDGDTKTRKNVLGTGTIPQSWGYTHTASVTGASEFRIGNEDAQNTISFRRLEAGRGGQQLNLSHATTLPAGVKHRIRVEYRTGANFAGKIEVRRKWEESTNVPHTWDLAASPGRWVTKDFDLTPTENYPSIVVLQNLSTEAAGNELTIRKFQISAVEAKPPTPVFTEGREAFRLDLAKQTPFRQRVKIVANPDKPTEKTPVIVETVGGPPPTDWAGRTYNPASEGEWEVRDEDGARAIGIRNPVGPGSMMVLSPRFTTNSGFCRLRLTYRADGVGTAAAIRYKQSLPTAVAAWDVKRLSETNGQWETVDVDVDLKGGTNGCLELHNTSTKPDATFWIRELVIREATVTTPVSATEPPAPATPFRAPGKVVYSLDLAGQEPFLQTQLGANLKEKTGPGEPPANWSASSKRGDCRHEFVAERRDGAMTLGLRIVAGSPEAMLAVAALPITANKSYEVRYEYMTTGQFASAAVRAAGGREAATDIGKLALTSGSWRSDALRFASGSWSTAKLEFHHAGPSGDGNELFVRKLQLVELLN